MKRPRIIFILVIVLTLQIVRAQEHCTVISLNGTWEFDQTTDAFPPEKFTRKIPVPGLIHLAEPRIEEYDKFFKRPPDTGFGFSLCSERQGFSLS